MPSKPAVTKIGKPCALGHTERYLRGSCAPCGRAKSLEKHRPNKEKSAKLRAESKANVIALYQAGYTIEKIVDLMKLSRAQVHILVHQDGLYRDKPWSETEILILENIYKQSQYDVDINRVARQLQRSRASVAKMANKLGITNSNAPNRPETVERSRATLQLKFAFGYQHPRGMLGKNHSEETKQRLRGPRPSLRRPKSAREKRNIALAAVRRLTKNPSSIYSRTKCGKREDLGDRFFRSAWEANIARWLTAEGKQWEYESKTFEFPVRKGTRFYTPDFYLPSEDRYIEVKGWWDDKSKTRMRRMAKYYRDVRIEIIDKDRYRDIAFTWKYLIPTWE